MKPIYLNKHYLFQNKIYGLDKIYKLNLVTRLVKKYILYAT